MMQENFTNIRSLLNAFAEALNLIDPYIENHHQQTAYLAYLTAKESGLCGKDIEHAVFAALFHDIGFIKNDYDMTLDEVERNAKSIAQSGACFINGFGNADRISNIVRYCQSSWSELSNGVCEAFGKPEKSDIRIASIVHIADYVSTKIQNNIPVLDLMKPLRKDIIKLKGTEFSEEAADAFLSATDRECVWLDLRYNPSFLMVFSDNPKPVSIDMAIEYTHFMSRIVDYRSTITAMHSAGVSVSAAAIGKKCGMSDEECKQLTIAGLLHDLGKLRISRTILAKPEPLTDWEFNSIKEHPYYSKQIISQIDGFSLISDWAGYHHEKLNGSGYPFRLTASELDTGSRIMAVADIFSAITEVRPYRDGMNRDESLKVLYKAAKEHETDGDIVDVLRENYDEINFLREEVSVKEGQMFFESMRICN